MQEQLDAPYPLSAEQVAFYRKNKYIKLKQVFSPELLGHYAEVISEKVKALNTQHLPLEARDTYSKAFLQIMNIWTEDADVQDFVFGKKLAGIASQLMEVEGVRLYHDQALFKEPGGGYTPWHADQYYWPLSNDNTITAWVPMQATPLEMGPLEFSAGSHVLQGGRKLKISDDSERVISEKLRINDFPHIIEPFELGEISFHSGWIFHRAGPNQTTQMRQVMTIIYMDKDICLKQPENDHQQADWEQWLPGAKVGARIETALNPILYSRK